MTPPCAVLFFFTGLFIFTQFRQAATLGECSELRSASLALLGFVIVEFVFSIPVIVNLSLWASSTALIQADDDALGEFAFDAFAQGCELAVATAQVLQVVRQARRMGARLGFHKLSMGESEARLAVEGGLRNSRSCSTDSVSAWKWVLGLGDAGAWLSAKLSAKDSAKEPPSCALTPTDGSTFAASI